MNSVTIPPEQTGERLDKALATLTDFSRSYINKLLHHGLVKRLVTKRLDTAVPPLKANTTVVTGECYELQPTLPAEQPAAYTPVSLPQQIIYEDEALLVINKLAGQVVHPGPGQRVGTIAQAAVDYCPTIDQAIKPVTEVRSAAADQLLISNRAGIVHRLDKATSGVLVIAKTANALSELQRQFKARAVTKIYYLITAGRLADTTVNQPIGRHPKRRYERAVIATGKEAITTFKLLNTYHPHELTISLVQACPKTGRTHQIRVHAAWLATPILGDPVYSTKASRAATQQLMVSRLLLHAGRLTLFHPVTQRATTFTAQLPTDFSTTAGENILISE